MVSFGEVNIPSSRAFWDDFEGEEIPEETHSSIAENK